MAELLHVGAFAATAVSTCCVAASGRRLPVRELALAVLMLVAMADVVLGWGLVAAVWWAAALVVSSMLAVVVPGGRPLASAVRLTRAMDGVGGILMAALLLLMSGAGAGAVGEHAAHSAHDGSSSALIWAVVAASVVFAAASIRMGLTMRMPSPHATPRSRVLRRVAPLAMGLSVLLMAAVVLV